MSTLSVYELMSSPVITVTPTTRLPQLKNMLRDHQIRRLPVIDDGQLVGIVTLGDVRNAFPSDGTTLSIYELSYLLDQVTAAEIMHTDVITIAPDAALTDAARLMLTHKVSGLPVMLNGNLVGIITESDIFRAMVAHHITINTVPPTSSDHDQSNSSHSMN